MGARDINVSNEAGTIFRSGRTIYVHNELVPQSSLSEP